jgi:hypothetical protein
MVSMFSPTLLCKLCLPHTLTVRAVKVMLILMSIQLPRCLSGFPHRTAGFPKDGFHKARCENTISDDDTRSGRVHFTAASEMGVVFNHRV